jgi:hypothetical protein
MLEAWKIGVRVSVLDSASIGLRAISRAFLAAEGDAGKLESRIKSIKGQLITGGLMIGAGVGILSMFKKPLEEAKAFQTETARFASLGFGDKVNGQAVRYAQGMKTIGTSTTENMALLSDAMAVFKDLNHAKFAAPIMAKMKFGNEALFGAGGGGGNERKFMDMLKVIEFRRGLNSQAEFATQADYVQKVIAGSRNRVDAGQMLQTLKAGGVSVSQLSNKAFYLGLEPMIQELGGFRVGTGSLALYNNLVQSRGSIASQQELYRLGLLDPSKVEFNKMGMVKKAMPGAFKGGEVLEKDGALALLNNVLLPAFASHGITKDGDVLQELSRVLSNSRGTTMISSLYQRRGQIAKMIDANQGAMGIDATVNAGKKTLAGQQIDLHAKFNNLMLQLGNAVLPIAIAGLEKLIPILQTMGTWMQTHQQAVKGFATALVGLGGLLIVGGTFNVIAASLRGIALVAGPLGSVFGGVLLRMPAFLGIVGNALLFVGRALMLNPIGLALTAVGLAAFYVYKHWATIGPYIKKAWNVVMALFHVGMDWISSIVKTVWTAIKPFAILIGHTFLGIFSTVTNAVGGFVSAVMGILSRLWGWLASSGLGKAIGGVGSAIGGAYSSTQAAVTHWADNENANYAAEHRVRPGARSPGMIHTTINMDGRKVAEAITPHQTRAATRAQTGTSGFDATQFATPIGVTGY